MAVVVSAVTIAGPSSIGTVSLAIVALDVVVTRVALEMAEASSGATASARSLFLGVEPRREDYAFI